MQSPQHLIAKCKNFVRDADPIKVYGRVDKGVGLVIEGLGPRANIGDICLIQPNDSARDEFVEAEVIGFREDRILLMPLQEMRGIGPGSRVIARGRQRYVRVERISSAASSMGLAIRWTAKGISTDNCIPSTRTRSIHSCEDASRSRLIWASGLSIRSLRAAKVRGSG